MKRCHAVVPHTEVKQFSLTVQPPNQGGVWVSLCLAAGLVSCTTGVYLQVGQVLRQQAQSLRNGSFATLLTVNRQRHCVSLIH